MESSSPSHTRHNPHGIDAILSKRVDEKKSTSPDRATGNGKDVRPASLVASTSGQECWHLLHHLHRQLQLAAASAHAAASTTTTINESLSSGSSETEVTTASDSNNVLHVRAGK